MISQFRQEEILESLENEEVVYIKDLSKKLGVSVSTVRRDVMKMLKGDNIELLRGGAVRLQKRRVDLPAEKSRHLNTDIKDRIGRKAAMLVEDGDVIFIDSGTTTSAMAKHLAGKNVLIVTTSLAVIRQLPIPGTTCITIGGEVLIERDAICGTLAERQLSNMYFDKAFLSISGYTDDGVFANDVHEARNKEIVKDRSYCTYLLADSSKLRRWGFIKFMEPDECTLITEADEPVACDGSQADEEPAPGEVNP